MLRRVRPGEQRGYYSLAAGKTIDPPALALLPMGRPRMVPLFKRFACASAPLNFS